MATIRTILLSILIFTLLCASEAKRQKSSRRRHKKALSSDHGSPPSTKENSGRYQNLLAENEVSGVSRVDENTWKWRTKSAPVQVDSTVTRRILEGPHDSLSFSMEVRPGSKKASTIFHAFSNFHRAGPTTWLEVLVDATKNTITMNYRTPTLARNSIDFTLPGPVHRNWIKLFVEFRKANEKDSARITCQVSCGDVKEQNITDGINLVLPADTTFELGGNSQNKSFSFGGQIRKAKVYIPSIFTYPWKCNNKPPTPTKGSAYTHKKRGLPADEPDISRVLEPVLDMESLARTELDARHERDIEELRLEMKSCRDENTQLNTMMQMMKQKQSSLEERIATLETCECIPMCLMRDGHKRRHGEIWKVNECKTCECTNGRTECENEEGCGEEIHACLSDPCSNDGVCKEVDDGYLCRCRRGFYGDHCEHVDRCDEGICQNGAECELLEEGGYRCLCKDGFTGRNCEQPLDYCRSSPCRNSAECVNTLSGYICNCRDGFTGSRCQDSDDCYSSPCLNGGACTSLFRGGYTCRCNSGFYGRNCELRDLCFSSPCLNGGRCRQARDSPTYACDCPELFHGKHCQFKDACFINPCLNGGRCRTGPLNGGTFTCECRDGYHGDRCEDEDACFRNPCLNGGRCRPGRLNGGSFTCECREGFHGDRCEDEDACVRNPCLNGGRCRPGALNGGTYTCECKEGFHGDRCQDEDACFRNPCMNGGRCRPEELNGGTFTCECREGFHGDRCQDRDACASNPCLNGGRCTSEPINGGTFSCECREGFHGVRCEDEDNCVSNPCLNGGRCFDRVSPTGARYTCMCPVSYSGPRCEIVDACYAKPCRNGGLCIPLSTGSSDGRFTCRCTDEFYGDRCELRAPCASNPCLNGGVCENRESGRYFCRCRATNYGDRCELTDYCRARPCKNGATCTNSPSEYDRPFTCDCRDLFTGPLCEFEDLCRRRPCLHDGTCRMEDGNYVCECQDSFYGKRCEKTDFCAENPCLNGGRCENEESGLGYECICPDSHTGDRCQQRHPCRPNPCLNNGRCRMTGSGSYACECPPPHTGPNCRLIDHCRSNPCLNRGICLNNGDAFECDCPAGFAGTRCQSPNQCASNPCQNGGRCVEENGSYKCICPPAIQGDRCQYTCNVCAYLKEEGECTGSTSIPETRWYFDKYTQKCQQFQFSGCGGNGNNFATRQSCRQKCLVGVCCMLQHSMIEINGHSIAPANYTCQSLSIGQCKRMDTQHREVQVIAFKAGVDCADYKCGTASTCSFGGEEFKINTRVNIGCRHSCACHSGGNIRCRCDAKTPRSEIRRLTTEERKAFQNAVRTLKTTEIEQGRNVWDLMRDEYINSYPVAQSSKYFLLWNRAFLRKMELLLQKVDCAVSIPYYDFTQDAGRFSEAVVWQPNFFGGDGNCVPDHPFRVLENGNAVQWKPCLTRNFSTSISIPCMVDIATALSSRTYEQLSGRLQGLVSHVNAFIGGDMATSTKAYDPLFYSVHAFMDNLFMIWQKNHPGNNELKNVRGVENIPFGMHPEDLWDGACVEYSALHETVACNRSDTSEELFATDGYNLQGYNRQGFDRDDFDKTGYNALGRDRFGRLDTRSIYKYDGFDAEGYGRDGYDRRGCDRFGFNKKGRDRDGFNAEGYDMGGFNRYGLDADGYDRRGFDVYGRDRYGKLDDSTHYDEETGFNDCCFGREGITPSGYDRFGFNVEGFDKNSCKYFFNGPHSPHYREKLWEMLSPQRASFLTSIARTCGSLKNLPKNQISLNWVNNPAYQASKLNSRRLQIRDSKAESMNHLMSKRFCFDVDMFLTWCPCLEPNYPAICSTNPCADANCPLHPDARCVINMCGRTCTAEFYLDGRRVNCDNPCSPNPCQNGGRCEPSRYSSASERFQCHCPEEYMGSLCEKPTPDTCMLSKRVGKCQATVTRWYYNFKAAVCEEFTYSGCGGNSNNFPSKRACDLRCSLGACCYRLPRNSTFQVGYDRDGFDKYGFNALGFNRRGQQRSAHDSMPTGNRIHPPKGFGPDGYDIYGYDVNGYDRQGYDRDGYHRDTGFNRKGFDPKGKYDQLREFDKNGFDRNGFDRAGFTCSGINRRGFNQLGLYYDFDYHCESLLLSECEALKDPGQLEIPFEVISFSPGNTCDEVKCGEECGCQVNGHIYHFGQKFRQGCESCTCTLGGVVECSCQRLGRRREIRDLTKTEREEYAAAIQKLYKSNKWEEFARQHAQYMPKANGVASSLPWHRYFLRMIEQEIQKVSNCEIFIPYFDWTIDVGSLENSQIWQASFFGGDGDEETNCVHHHLFAREVRWHPCIKRKFDKTISLPDAVNFHLLLQEPNYDNFRLQLEMMSSLFHLYVGGHMASPFSPYDPLYLSHWAFIDYIWNEWQKKNPMGLSRFPAKHRYMQMMPFVVTPDNVLSSEKQMCVIYIPPTIGSLCNTTLAMRWPPSIRDENGLDRHGFDERGYDVDGYNIKGVHRSGRTDARGVFDKNGYDNQGYQRSGFDASGWDKFDYNEMNFDRDGFDIEWYDATGYNRYGFDRDDKTPFGMFKNMTFAKGFDSGYAASLFDKDGYNSYGFDKNGFDRKGFDAFGFNSKGLDQDNCNYYNHGPHYMRYFYHVQEQLSLLGKEMLKNVKRICPPISSLPEYWASHIWLEKMPLARSFEKAWAEDHEVDVSWKPRTSSVTEELLWLPMTPDRQFCFNMNWFSGCPLGSRLMDCTEDRCAQSSCASHPKAKCRMKNCGACYPEFYDGKTGEIFQCYGCVAKSGKMHNEGSTWHEGCNTCVCQAGLIACSPMPCPSHACSHPAPGPDGCCDVCNSCEYEERIYRNHQRFRPNSCESCECVDGSVMCDNAVSNCPTVTCSRPVKLPDECCPTCSTDCRGHRNRDSWIMDKCHNCSCVEDKIVCSKNRCPVVQCSHPRTSAGECCPKCMGCEYKGKNYRHMQNFMENSCSQCSCRFGSVMCTTQQCPPLTCKHKEKTPGACCSRCRRGCEYEGVFYDNGISFQPRNNPCLECSCQDGQPRCLRMTCPRVSCSRPIIPDGKCCPQCASCRKGGVEYREGQMWTSDDRCQRCVCQRGEEVCRNIIPCRDNCLHGLVRRGQCCPDCSRCSYHGKIFQHLEPFTDPEDDCKRCTCQSGNVVCSNIVCPQLRCRVRETPEGECCPRCKSCVYEGALREHGSSWRIPQYPCTTCTCREGQIDCEEERCPSARCDYPSTPDGSCCPVCRGCSYRGRTYSDRDVVEADDSCSSCRCMAGDIVCRKKACPPVLCHNPVTKPGACCESCATCEYDDQTYEDGRVFIAPRSPCLECTCRGGEVNCRRLDLECARTLCSNPGRNRSQCCPTCDSCEYERRNYNDGTTFMPSGASPCVKCTCRAGTVRCNTETCPPISCPNPVRKPGICCSLCEECVQDGRTYNNGQRWKSDTCTECRCSAGNIRCQAVSCPTVTCSHPATLSNECCPSCAKCFYNGQIYSEERQFQSPTDRCQICTCRAGTVTCIRQSCPSLDCPNPVRIGRACCPTCPVDCEYMGVTIANGATVNHPDERCTECTCTDGRVQCERRRCTREVGCTHPTSDGCCRDVCDDCRYLGSVIKNGQNKKPPGDPCRTCTCTDGNVVCLRQRCPRPKCDNPKRIAGKCCPECPEPLRGCEYEEKEISHGNQFENRCRVCSCYDGDVTCRAVSCPPVRCSAPVKHECCLSCSHGCSIGGVKYKKGQVVAKQNGDKCDVCHCREGEIVCKKRKCRSVECSNPRSDGCCPACQGCRYAGEDYADETSFPDPDDKCNVCTCKLGNVDCVQMKCEVSCTHPLSGDCCPTCGGDCLLDGKIYKQNGGMFTLPSDEHQCQMCVCDAGSIVCKNKPCPKVNCRNPVVNECGCPSCTDCLYNEIKRSNKETFANPENEKCSDCYCSNGNVVCGQRTCKSSSCTHPVRDDCDCPRCDQCLYYGRTYERDEVFPDAEDKCNSCECQDGSVICGSKKCPAVTCSHPSTDECGCTQCLGCNYGGVERDNLERFTDPANKCNECTCQNGVVTCTRAQCVPTPCSHPVLATEDCCPKCIGMCHAEGKSYEDGASFTKESDPCSICSCSSGNVRCVRQRCGVRCSHPIAQSQCCPDCSACLYQGLRHEEGDAFIPIDNNCKQCFCHRGNVICNDKKCPEPKCENPRPVRGSCCPKCLEAQTSECVVNGLTQKTGARWIQNDNFGQCQECTCFESGITSCATSECNTKCTNPVPRLDQCCPVCGPCYYGNRTYNSGTMFQPDRCNDCICTNGNVKCVRKECQPLTCPSSKQVQTPGDCCPRCQSCVMAGKIYSDHQSWTSQDDPCQECHCLNGVVTCAQVQCLQPCQMMVSIPGQCCPVCAGCFYNSKVFQIGESFKANPMDPCEICECQASPSGAPVMCCKRQECPSLADCPRSCIRQALPGQCCPTCTNRPECAYGHCTPGSHGRQIVPAENRCYACDCQSESTWLCMREKCKKLDCPVLKQYTPKGTCCPVCDECHLDLANKDVPSGHVWQLSECEICKCDKGSVMCIKQECPQLPLKCNTGTVPYKQPGQCCHKCVNVDAPCSYEGQSVRPHHKWNADHCTTCTCFAGEVKCVTQRCRMLRCLADQAPTAVPGECCPRCMPRPASCTAFGDPHYKTFDGRMVHFQGTCQYLLTADCSKSEFKVIVHNTKNTGTRRRVSWTEQVTLITAGGTVALMKDYSVRVNGTVIRRMPVTLLPYFYIEVVGNYMSLSTHLGVHISWNGRQQRLEVTVPGTYKRRTCGLCGNFNNFPQDDTRLHNSRITTSDAEFGNDWKVNLPSAPPCPNVEDLNPCSGANYATRTFANEKCKILRSPTFAACHALVNPEMYFAACVYDVCACGENDPTCLCDILEAYAAQCRRSGIVVRWRSPTLCAINCRYDRGYVFDECGSPCKRTCANRNLPPGTIAAQCYLPCVSGCQCPAGKVEHGERCVYPDVCPANVVSTIEEPLPGVMPPIQHMAPAPSHMNRHSRLVRPPLVAPPRQMLRGHK